MKNQCFSKIFLSLALALTAANTFAMKPTNNQPVPPAACSKNLGNEPTLHATYAPQINQLINQTNNAYTASLPLMASAALGDSALYATSLTNELRSLHNLDENPLPAASDTNQWMENNAFKAWMWGRVLLSADAMCDSEHIAEAKQKLSAYLKAPRTANDSPAFIAWARAYLASLNTKTYASQKHAMITESQALSATYSKTQKHDDLSNALWAWVMDNQAASLNHDKATYESSLGEIAKLMKVTSVADALNTGLTRSAASNDYPAWAMAIVYLSATRMNDQAITSSLFDPLTASMNGAKQANQLAEWTLAELNTALAKSIA